LSVSFQSDSGADIVGKGTDRFRRKPPFGYAKIPSDPLIGICRQPSKFYKILSEQKVHQTLITLKHPRFRCGLDYSRFFIQKSSIPEMQIKLSQIFHPKIHDPRYADSIIEDFSSENRRSQRCRLDYRRFSIQKSMIQGMQIRLSKIFHPKSLIERMRIRLMKIFHPKILYPKYVD
jgi:hypothetical protein